METLIDFSKEQIDGVMEVLDGFPHKGFFIAANVEEALGAIEAHEDATDPIHILVAHNILAAIGIPTKEKEDKPKLSPAVVSFYPWQTDPNKSTTFEVINGVARFMNRGKGKLLDYASVVELAPGLSASVGGAFIKTMLVAMPTFNRLATVAVPCRGISTDEVEIAITERSLNDLNPAQPIEQIRSAKVRDYHGLGAKVPVRRNFKEGIAYLRTIISISPKQPIPEANKAIPVFEP